MNFEVVINVPTLIWGNFIAIDYVQPSTGNQYYPVHCDIPFLCEPERTRLSSHSYSQW